MTNRAFTMIETLVAISLLTISIVAPMALTEQSLSSAYYARDQVTASYLAQEAIEALRQKRDNNILATALGTPTDLLNGFVVTDGSPFTVDTRTNAQVKCSGTCPPLQTDGTLFGYDASTGWTNTIFTRTVTATFVPSTTDEIRVIVTVSWQSGGFQARSLTMTENMYRWVDDGSATP